jgi:hypothetical protein
MNIGMSHNEERPHSSLGCLTPQEFATKVSVESYGKDGGHAALENASGVSHFPTAPAAAAGGRVEQTCRIIP